MYLTYHSSIDGETKRLDIESFEQDLLSLRFKADLISTSGLSYTISEYMHLWAEPAGRVIGTQVKVYKDDKQIHPRRKNNHE